MNSKDLILMSLQNLARRKSRTILTVIGVVIGTCSIVIMLSLGIALDKNFHEQISEMGNLNIIEIHNYYGPDMGNNGQVKLDEKAIASFEQIPGVEAVMPRKSMYLKIGTGKLVAEVDVVGIKPEIMPAFDFEIDEGRLLTSTDKEVIIFGQHIPYSFYNPRLKNRDCNPWDREGPPPVDLVNSKLVITSDMQFGERVRNRDPDQRLAKQYEFKGVGVLKEKNDERDYSAYINMATLERMIKEEERTSRRDESRRGASSYDNDEYTAIKVKCAHIEQVADVQETIKAMGFQTFSLTDMIESVKKQSRTLQGILGGIGAVSLFVAAIGITNTMIMSIYERTREIGVIKVLGAQLQDIKRLFLIEAGFIGFIGGVIGLILSYLISFGLNKLGASWTDGGYISVIPAYLAIGAVGFATLVGLISGYSPARRAMNLSALEAIRSE